MATKKSTVKKADQHPTADPKKPTVEAMDEALNDQRGRLFTAMGVVGLAARAVQSAVSPIDGSLSMNIVTDVWTALDCAYEILDSVAGKLESSETLTAKGMVTHG